MPKNRKGAQNPTKLIKRPYKNSRCEEAVALYEKSGRTAQRVCGSPRFSVGDLRKAVLREGRRVRHGYQD